MDFSGFNITIVGLGLIGGSLAMAIRDLSPNKLWGIDRDFQTILSAQNKGIIDEELSNTRETLSNSDIVIIALYPGDTVNFVVNNMDNFKPGSIITDTCGLKEEIINKLRKCMREDIEFIGGHPMAGKEFSGFSSADKSIFINSNYFITPIESNSKVSLGVLEELIIAIGCKKPILISPEEHDKIIAYTSHLPHLAAISLINCSVIEKNLDALIGGSFRDATRVAAINSELWLQLLKSNKSNVINILEQFISHLNNIKNAIENNDDEILLADFKKASLRRKELS